MVDIKVIEKEGDKFAVDGNEKTYRLKLLISDVTPQFLNVLRRAIEEEVRTLAIEDVYIMENSSAMWDEMIAHRLGLVVLNTPEDLSYDQRIVLHLEKKGKGYVFASDIRSENKKVYPVYPDTIIAYLGDNHSIKIRMEAVFGKGKEHAKWKPGHVYYYRLVDLKLKEELNEEEKEKLKVLGVRLRGKNFEIAKDKVYDRTFLDAIYSVARYKIEEIPRDEFVFVIESYGHYSAERILNLAIYELKIMLKELLDFLMK
ncbi:MAG: DNA-directed RNA polymerase subunit D [Candidatus Nanoclepta minutus]|uniref:DNA-directed RNA polymerase subunit Rpo3 n=1 Tax=Candidatus Nanoclepta minutus TaxID=1940235 RepID=A0A397WPX2_9ARCH|nr:MAG: DNA-directed RNA polymerase subunit D [Candidatus Nanoclepta minutus]